MKQEFSNMWNASIQPRKQRKYLANAPLHVRHQILSSNLSKELRKKYGKRSFPIRKGDEIKIMNGEFRKKTGKVDLIDLKDYRVTIEGIQKTKKDGTKIKVFFHPSNLQIKDLNLDDKKRKEALERKLVSKKQKPVDKKEIKSVSQKTEPKKEIKLSKPMQSSSSRNEEPAIKTKKSNDKSKEIKKHAPKKK